MGLTKACSLEPASLESKEFFLGVKFQMLIPIKSHANKTLYPPPPFFFGVNSLCPYLITLKDNY